MLSCAIVLWTTYRCDWLLALDLVQHKPSQHKWTQCFGVLLSCTSKLCLVICIVLHAATSMFQQRSHVSSRGRGGESISFLCAPLTRANLHYLIQPSMAYYLMLHWTCFEHCASLHMGLCGHPNTSLHKNLFEGNQTQHKPASKPLCATIHWPTALHKPRYRLIHTINQT